MKQKSLNLFLLAAGLVFLGVLSRLTAHAWNFTMMGGLALFAGAFFKRQWVSAAVVFGALLISDAVIGFHSQMPGVYLSFGLMALMGALLLSKPSSRLTVLSTSLAGSLVFFLMSNFFVWLEGSLYPQTWNGLVQCYIMAEPFYRTQLLSDMISTVVLFEVARAMKSFVTTRFDQTQVNPMLG